MGSKLFKQFIKKSLAKQTRGSGPPGPPPRQGLQWKPQTHRWIRPRGGEGGGDVVVGDGDKPYNPGEASQKKDQLQQVMNQRLGEWINEGRAGLGQYDLSQNQDMFGKVHNEVMLGDYPGNESGSVFSIAGVGENPSDADEQQMWDLMDELTETAMAHHGLENEQPEDYEDEDSDPEYDYDFFQSNAEEEGLMGKIPESLNSYKSDWENRDASDRPEWGSDEWKGEVGELTFDIGFAMPEDDADLTRAESDISDAITSSGVEGFEEFGGVVNPDSTYEDFLSNVQEAGLQDRIPGFLNEYKSDWEARDASVRPEWGSGEWADEVGDVTFDIGFAMPEGGDNEDEELTRAEDWISSAIANSGVEGFENYGS